jgi:hypothetical protein
MAICLQRRPSVLINQIVRHFSRLFQVASIEGVLPKINVRSVCCLLPTDVKS